MSTARGYERLRRGLGLASAFFAGLGPTLAFGGELAFGSWRDAVAPSPLDRSFPDALAEYASLTDRNPRRLHGRQVGGHRVARLAALRRRGERD